MNKRILTVSAISNYHYRSVPFIRIQGQWLRNLGFEIGDKIRIEESYRCLRITVINPNSDRESK